MRHSSVRDPIGGSAGSMAFFRKSIFFFDRIETLNRIETLKGSLTRVPHITKTPQSAPSKCHGGPRCERPAARSASRV